MALPFSWVQNAALWLFIASSWFVFIEPAPYELLFVITLLLFLPGGLAVSGVLVPLIVFLILYNLGGALSVVQVSHLPKTIQFVAVSFYMATTAVFFAFAVLRDPKRIVSVLNNAYLVAAVPACVIALAGYFDVTGLGETLSPLGRAQGTFKDPNVLGTFLIYPAVLLANGFVRGTLRWRPLALMVFLLCVFTVFVAFSRGGWVNMAASISLMIGLTFIVSNSMRLRSRIILMSITGLIVLVAMFMVALSFEEIRLLFFERAALLQPYDQGEIGRFGKQLRSLSVLLESPNGLGAFGFGRMFSEDPHNVYLNAFFAYGWLGGFSYLLLIFSTIAICWRAVFTVSPYQQLAIPVVSVLLATMLQGVQIDTDHWRHFYLLLGLAWGLGAATYLPQPGKSAATVSQA
jgi:O-antigen ligase